jgi:hypothetical protein
MVLAFLCHMGQATPPSSRTLFCRIAEAVSTNTQGTLVPHWCKTGLRIIKGPGISFFNPPITVVGNTIVGNLENSCCSPIGSEVYAYAIDRTALFENNLIVATGPDSAFFCNTFNGSPTLDNNDVFAANNSAYGGTCSDPSGTDGNISADPLFVDLLSNNIFLQSGSPAIAAGIKSAPDEPKFDFDDNARIIGGKIDIGADEYVKKPALLLSSSELRFEPQDIGSSSAVQVLTLTNQKSVAVKLDLIAVGSSFRQTNNCGTSLAPSASCQISVTFAPLFGGTVNGALGIFHRCDFESAASQSSGNEAGTSISIQCLF